MIDSTNIWRHIILQGTATIAQAINILNETSVKIVLVANHENKLEGTLSDGDIRRGLLKGLDLYSPILDIVHRNPLVVTPEISRELVKQLMLANKVQQIPVVDKSHNIVGLHLWEKLTTEPTRHNLMVIMAGGMGKRLHPHTENCPKPLLPVSGKPMLQHIIEHSKREGFSNFLISINYLGHMIENYFGDGASMGVNIDYLRELSPLGTAGSLSLMSSLPDAPFVVANGDVITDINYGEILDFHIRHSAAGTMAVRMHEWQHPFGVVETEGLDIVGFDEKPIARSHINAGVYVLDPIAVKFLTIDTNCDMPQLFERLLINSLRTIAYPMHEPWLDVGRPDDYAAINKVNK